MSNMSAPIPNLLTLRGARSGSGSGAPGRGGPRRGLHSGASASGHDAVIQSTDTDAAVSRMSAVELGYLEDAYARYFIPVAQGGIAVRRLPIINRGTYTRTVALDRLIGDFLAATEGQERQIVSLGAGTDTRAFRLFKAGNHSKLIYHEVDFPSVTSKKYNLVKSTSLLSSVMPKAALINETQTWRADDLPGGSHYICHGVDLRDLSKPDITFPDLRTDIPTLLISECCLCYLEVAQAITVLAYFTDRIPHLSCIIYEPIHPTDAFGKQMVSNLAARRIRMPTLEEYTDESQQISRLQDAGFASACSASIEKIWKEWIAPEEKERVDRLEGLDEVEEWNLLAGHYSVSWGWRGIDLDSWQKGAS